MSGPWGLLPTGFAAKKLADIILDMQTEQLLTISPDLDLFAPDPLAVVTGIVAQAIADLWELAHAVYGAMDADTASGEQLDALALLTGTLREDATKTLVVGSANVAAGFSAAAGTMFANVPANPSLLFTNVASVPLQGAPAVVSVTFQCVSTGPNAVNAGTLTGIASPLVGWNSITNAADGVPGKDIEGDPALRLDREAELQGAGSGTAGSIRAAVLKQFQPANSPLTFNVSGLDTPFAFNASTIACTVLYNDTDAVDGTTGLTAHSIEVIAYAPGAVAADDIALCQLILNTKAAGITSYSGTPTHKDIVDSQGNTESVYYTRPTTLRIYIAITVKAKSGATVTAAQVKQVLLDYANGANGIPGAWQPGAIIYKLHTESQAFNLADVLDVTAFTIDIITPPVGVVNIVTAIRQVGTLATGDITVTVT